MIMQSVATGMVKEMVMKNPVCITCVRSFLGDLLGDLLGDFLDGDGV